MLRAFHLVFWAIGLLVSMPLIACAHGPKEDSGSFFVADRAAFSSGNWLRVRRVNGIPQVDSNAAGAAFTLLAGSVLIVMGKRRKDP